MFTKLLIFLTIAWSHDYRIVLCSSPDKEISTSIGQCLIDICNRYFTENLPVAIQLPIIKFCGEPETYYSHNDDTLFIVFNEESNYQQVILNCYVPQDLTPNFFNKPKLAFVILPDLKLKYMKIHIHLSLIEIKNSLGNLGVPAVIISSHVFTSKKEQIHTVLGLLNKAWRNASTEDIIILVPEVRKSPRTSNKNFSIEIYSWLPERQRDTCLTDLNEVTLLDTWISSERRFRKNSDLFPKKNMIRRNCNITVGLYQAPPHVYFNTFLSPGRKVTEASFKGVYKSFFEVLKQHYNFSFSFYNAHVEHNKYDITVPEYLGADAYTCSVVYPRFTSTLTWYVPIFPIPRWQGLIRVFGSTQWLLVAIIYLLGSLTFLLITKVEHKTNLNVTMIFINTLKTHLAIGIPYKCKGIVSTAFMTLWLLYCIQVCTYFQTELIGFLANPGNLPQINDFTALNISGFEIMSNVVHNEEDHADYPLCILIDCLTELAKQRKLAVLVNSFEFETQIKYNFSINEKPQIVKVKDPFRTFYMSATTTRGCLFAQRINTIMEKSVEGGLTNKWLSEFRIKEWESVFFQHYRSESYVRPLSVTSLQTHFYLLLGGLLLSLLVFLMEVLNGVTNALQLSLQNFFNLLMRHFFK